MEKIVFGNLKDGGIEVVERDGRYFVRYDAGSHQMVWREDEISSEELVEIRSGKAGEYRTLLAMQKRLTNNGEDPHVQNWTPPTAIH